MNIPLYHGILSERRRRFQGCGVNCVYNAVEVKEPAQDVVDCTPDGNMRNFRHLVDGHVLMYAELANSTPHYGHIIRDEYKPLVRLNARTSCVFSMADMRMMRSEVVGVKIFPEHGMAWIKQPCGEVVEASVAKFDWHGKPYGALCALCFVDRDVVERKRVVDGLSYISFSIMISKETCCKCGKSSTITTPCDHIRDGDPSSVMSVCTFRCFTDFAVEA